MTELAIAELTCEHCRVGLARHARITIEMKPGKDGIPWFLCLRCWMDGIRPMNRIGEVPHVEVAPDPERERSAPRKKKRAS